MTMTNTTLGTSWENYLDEVYGLADQMNPMPAGGFLYQGYTITPVINHNPHLFHNWDACPANSSRRRVGKTVYLVTLQGYADETYFKNLQTAKKFIRNCNAR